MSEFQPGDYLTKGRERYVLDWHFELAGYWWANVERSNRKGVWGHVNQQRVWPGRLLATNYTHTRPVKHEKPKEPETPSVVVVRVNGRFADTWRMEKGFGGWVIDATARVEPKVPEPTPAQVDDAIGEYERSKPNPRTPVSVTYSDGTTEPVSDWAACYTTKTARECAEAMSTACDFKAHATPTVYFSNRDGFLNTSCGTPVGYAGRASTMDTAGCCGGMTAVQENCPCRTTEPAPVVGGVLNKGDAVSSAVRSDAFAEHLRKASATVATWPKWKQECLGGTATEPTSAPAPPKLPDLPTPPVGEPWFTWELWNDYLKAWYDDARQYGYGSSISTWLWSEANRLNREQKQSADDASAARQIQAARKPKPKGGGK
jgi:hypothetical protein